MIRFLKGSVIDKDEKSIILLAEKTGYQVFVPNEILAAFEEELSLFIHMHVREDAITLFGFRTKKELKLFELLLTINGVGPKIALEILNEPADTVQNAIFSGDVHPLLKISGIGKKTAERIILELKGKVEPSGIEQRDHRQLNKTLNPDAMSALERLGYKKNQIEKVLSEMGSETENIEEIIRYFLQHA